MALLKFPTHHESSRTQDERRESLEFGKMGEQMAAKYLVDQGYIILEHNYRRGHLEIDLIALDKDELVIVEVKSRAYDTILQPEDAVDHKKRLSLIRLANEYVKTHNRKENVRFDIVSIISNNNGTEIKHLKNAYNVMSF
ncbi:MAG: YraN family protein [Bacteroidales bacterium]|nr:YraN family protein [Bacteroidales bacterium]